MVTKRLVLRYVTAGSVGDCQDDDNRDDDPHPVSAGHRELHLLTASGHHPGDAQADEDQQDDSAHQSAFPRRQAATAGPPPKTAPLRDYATPFDSSRSTASAPLHMARPLVGRHVTPLVTLYVKLHEVERAGRHVPAGQCRGAGMAA